MPNLIPLIGKSKVESWEKLPMLWVDRGSQSAAERTKQTSAQTVNSAECKCGSGFRSLTEPLMEGKLVDGGMS